MNVLDHFTQLAFVESAGHGFNLAVTVIAEHADRGGVYAFQEQNAHFFPGIGSLHKPSKVRSRRNERGF